MPTFLVEEAIGRSSAKPPRPIKMHVQPRTLLPRTLGQPATDPLVSASAPEPPTKAPPPERSTPRLGGPRRAPPPERSTPRLGGPRPTPPQGASGTTSDEDANDTLLTTRRKQHLVAQATTDPDESLYGVVGTNTHRKLQLAADENSRRIWAAAVAGQKRLPRTSRPLDTRWVPGALYVAAIAIVVFGFWLWNHKAERNSRPAQITLGELPTQSATQEATRRVHGASSAPPGPALEADGLDSPATEPTSLPGTSTTRQQVELPKQPQPTKTAATAATGRPRLGGAPKKASEQRIFTDAPF